MADRDEATALVDDHEADSGVVVLVLDGESGRPWRYLDEARNTLLGESGRYGAGCDHASDASGHELTSDVARRSVGREGSAELGRRHEYGVFRNGPTIAAS